MENRALTKGAFIEAKEWHDYATRNGTDDVVYVAKVRAALELLRERAEFLRQDAKSDSKDDPFESDWYKGFEAGVDFMELEISKAFPAFAKEEKEPQGPILKKVPCVKCGWNYTYRIDGQ